MIDDVAEGKVEKGNASEDGKVDAEKCVARRTSVAERSSVNAR